MLTFDRVFQVCLAACDCAALVALQLQWRGEFGSRGVAPAADAVRKVRRLVASVRAAEDAAEPPQPVPPPPQQQPPPPPRSGVERTWQFFAMSALRLAADALAPHWRAARRAARDLRLGLSLAPTAFLVTGASDRALLGAFAAGYVAIALLATGVAPVAGALLFAAVHASFTTVAQPWLGLQFEPLLVESNAVFAVGYAFRAAAPWLWTTLLRWLTFRLMFAAGAGKLSSGDPAWRDGRAMAYHYMTQPLPNALSRFMHRLPRAWHNFETAATFLFEGPLALTFFSSHRALRWAGFLGTAAFNAAIAATGNYGHLHILTVTDALAIVADTSSCASSGGGKTAAPSQTSWLAVSCPPPPATWLGWGASWLLWAAGLAVGAAYVAVSLVPFTSNFSGLVSLELSVPGWERLEAAYAAASRWHVVGAYNLFATMTRFRWELQLEGTADGGATWHPFGYWHKPGGGPESLDDRPRTLPLGFFLRTDWRMWFLPLAAARMMRLGLDPLAVGGGSGWYAAFARKVLEGEPDVLALLRVPPPLRGARLDAVRTLMYDYDFSDGHTSWAAQQRERDAAAAAAADAGTAAPTAGELRQRKRNGPAGGGRVVTAMAPVACAPAAAPAPTPLTLAVVRRSVPGGAWQEGAWWKRRCVGLYDVQLPREPAAAARVAAAAAHAGGSSSGSGSSGDEAASRITSRD